MKAVYIVKQAVATGLGSSIEENWDRLVKGESAIAAVAPRQAHRSGGRGAALIPDLVPVAGENRVCAAARRALDRIRPVSPDTCIVWTGLKGNAEYIEGGGKKAMPFLPGHYRRWVAGLLGNRGPWLDISAACASSTVGLAIGAQKIAQSEYGGVLVCAADVVTGFVAAGFSALKALTAGACRPFDSARDGMSVGDGAVAMLLADVPLEYAVGRGAGADDEILQRKRTIVSAAVERVRDLPQEESIAAVGGLEIVAMAGLMARAAEAGLTIILDGYVTTASALISERLQPGTVDNLIAAHLSAEPGHRLALTSLDLTPFLEWDMRLGEGTGALLLMPMLDAAAAMVSNMATFADLGIPKEAET